MCIEHEWQIHFFPSLDEIKVIFMIKKITCIPSTSSLYIRKIQALSSALQERADEYKVIVMAEKGHSNVMR